MIPQNVEIWTSTNETFGLLCLYTIRGMPPRKAKTTIHNRQTDRQTDRQTNYSTAARVDVAAYVATAILPTNVPRYLSRLT